jgi:hypothetical protein
VAALSDNQSGIEKFLWDSQDADGPMLFNYMSDRSLRLDNANHPHIAFGGDHLYYAYHDGANWNFDYVDEADGVGLFASLALDAAGLPHISYYDSIHGALKYAYYNGADWVSTTLDQCAIYGEEELSYGALPWVSQTAMSVTGIGGLLPGCQER